MKNILYILLATLLLFGVTEAKAQCVTSVAPTGISGTLTICNGASTALTVTGGTLGTGAQWKWYTGSCGGTLVDSGEVITVSPSTTTTYRVRAEGGCSSTTACTTGTVTVNATPAVPIYGSSDTTVCEGVDASLRGYSTGNTIYWYLQATGGSWIDTTASHAYYTARVDSNITYYIEARSAAGCVSNGRAARSVIMIPAPDAPGMPTSNSPRCGNVALTRAATPPTGINHYWGTSFNMGMHVGNYGETYTVSNSNVVYIRSRSMSTTCWGLDTVSLAVIVYQKPSPPDSIVTNSPQCSNVGVTLSMTNTPPPGQTWYWQPRSARTYTTDSLPTYTVKTSGNTTPCIRALDTLGCWSEDRCKGITVYPAPATPTSVTPSAASNVCTGAAKSIKATSAGNSIDWYRQATGGTLIGSSASDSLYTVYPDTTMRFYAAGRSGAGCVSTNRASTGLMTAIAVPAAPTAPAQQSVCSDSAHVFTFSSIAAGSGGNQIEWARNSAFTSSTVVSSPATIYDTVASGVSDTIWMRSKASGTGCVSGAVWTKAKTNSIPQTGIIPAPISVSSDTAYTFNFDSVVVGYGGHQIEWGFDSAFLNTTIASSPTDISFKVSPFSDTLIWLRSRDSISGCVSDAGSTIAIVTQVYQRQPLNVDSVVIVCSGSSTTINIPNTQHSKRYDLRIDTMVVSSSIGNDTTVYLSTGDVTENTFFNILRTDTATGDTSILGYGILVQPLELVDTNVLIEGDTFVYMNDTAFYHASAGNGIKAIYSIFSGSAKVDSLQGYVTGIGSDFTLEARINGPLGCGAVTGYLRVTVTEIDAPIVPESKEVVADSFMVVTVSYDSVLAGYGGNQIEWATNDRFENSTIVSSPATISIDLETGMDTVIWLRSRNSETGGYSQKSSTRGFAAPALRSAGLLDKSRWRLAWNDEFDYERFNDQNFLARWDLQLPWGNAYWSENPNNNKSREYYNFNHDGSAREVDFPTRGIATITATKLSNTYWEDIDGPNGPTPAHAFNYMSGTMTTKFFEADVSKPGLVEVRCKMPSLLGGNAAFWMLSSNHLEYDIVEGMLGSKRTTSTIHDNSTGAQLEWNSHGEGWNTQDISCHSRFSKKLTNCDYSEGYHTYSMIFSDSKLIFFVDGKETWSVDRNVSHYPHDDALVSLDLIIGMGVGEEASDEKYEFNVDYVRYYKPADGTNDLPLSLQNAHNGTVATTLESPNQNGQPSNNWLMGVANRNNGPTSSVKPDTKIAYANDGSHQVFFCGSGNMCYSAYANNGEWYEGPLSYWVTDVAGSLTVDKDRVYYRSTNGQIKFFQWMPNIQRWMNAGTGVYCNGDFNVDHLGRLYYQWNGNVYAWCPTNMFQGEVHQITTTSDVWGGLRVHSCGCLLFYEKNGGSSLMQKYWWGNWSAPITIVSGMGVTSVVTIDEKHSRIFFVGGNRNIHSYKWNYGNFNPAGLVKLSNTCDDDNAPYFSHLDAPVYDVSEMITMNNAKNMIFFKSDDRIWYYYSDLNHDSYNESWHKTILNYSNSTTGYMDMEPWDNGKLFYVGGDDKIHFVDWINADNPANCPNQGWTPSHVFKTDVENGNDYSKTEKDILNERARETGTLTVYPNPSASTFTFYINSDIKEENILMIYDIKGQEIFRQKYSGTTITWNATNNSEGVYYYQLKGINDVFSGKLAKL